MSVLSWLDVSDIVRPVLFLALDSAELGLQIVAPGPGREQQELGETGPGQFVSSVDTKVFNRSRY